MRVLLLSRHRPRGSRCSSPSPPGLSESHSASEKQRSRAACGQSHTHRRGGHSADETFVSSVRAMKTRAAIITHELIEHHQHTNLGRLHGRRVPLENNLAHPLCLETEGSGARRSTVAVSSSGRCNSTRTALRDVLTRATPVVTNASLGGGRAGRVASLPSSSSANGLMGVAASRGRRRSLRVDHGEERPRLGGDLVESSANVRLERAGS